MEPDVLPFSPSSDKPPQTLPEGWDRAPLEIDVGCHKGLFLVAMAELLPDRNFLGIELQTERVEKTRRKIKNHGVPNAEVWQGEGLECLKGLPDGCADYIHVLFPDPWPKRRHHTRRLVQTQFLQHCARLLKPGAILRLVTDHEQYAESMREVVAGAEPFTLVGTTEDREYPLTEFQKKFLTDGRPVYRLILRRD